MDIFVKTMGYTGPLNIFAKTKECLRQKYGIHYGIYLSIAMGYIRQKLTGIFSKSMGYLWDIIGNIYK